MGQFTQALGAPIVEDGGAPIAAGEALFVHTTLAQLLPGINHHRVRAHKGGSDQCRQGFRGIAAEEVGSNALFVVIFEEVEHVVLDVVRGLPSVGDGGRRRLPTHHSPQSVVKSHLVIKVVEPSFVDIAAIEVGIVDLSNEVDVRIGAFDLGNGIVPKLHRHHLDHVAAEGIHAFRSPEEQDVHHLVPSAGRGGKVLAASAAIVDAIVQFDGLIPVVASRPGGKLVVAGGFGGMLQVGELHSFRGEVVRVQRLAPAVVEVVVRREV